MRIKEFVSFLGLKSKFDIQLRNTSKDTATAEYWCLRNEKGKIKRHIIRIYLLNIWNNTNERDLETLIAHELIHAWQEEKGYTDNHGGSFILKAYDMSTWFNMPNINDSSIDIT